MQGKHPSAGIEIRAGDWKLSGRFADLLIGNAKNFQLQKKLSVFQNS